MIMLCDEYGVDDIRATSHASFASSSKRVAMLVAVRRSDQGGFDHQDERAAAATARHKLTQSTVQEYLPLTILYLDFYHQTYRYKTSWSFTAT